MEAFTELAVVAGATSRIERGTSVPILPLRHPLHVAKVVATIETPAPGCMQLGGRRGVMEGGVRNARSAFRRVRPPDERADRRS
ncbi:LLM class flavin-dependent oxidoreductase [Rhodococcus opacus]|uniref:LLM class flavin-dependent oxidoreductase n=1 Tax=Rhodococcus opacus TaxID=37919 RepID=UPI003D7BE8C6